MNYRTIHISNSIYTNNKSYIPLHIQLIRSNNFAKSNFIIIRSNVVQNQTSHQSRRLTPWDILVQEGSSNVSNQTGEEHNIFLTTPYSQFIDKRIYREGGCNKAKNMRAEALTNSSAYQPCGRIGNPGAGNCGRNFPGFSRETSVTMSVNRPEHTEPVEEEAGW